MLEQVRDLLEREPVVLLQDDRRPLLLADALKIAIAALMIPAGWALLSRNRSL